jgi:alkylhydroperoxidase family enzyme
LAKREGLTEEAIDRVADYAAGDFPPRTQLALRFADRFAEDHQAIDDTFLGQLRAQFSEPEIVELGLAVGTFLALGRLIHIFDLHYQPEPDGAPGLG